MRKLTIILLSVVCFVSCSDSLEKLSLLSDGQPIQLSGTISQQNVTRANEQGFVTGDRMGIYVVDRMSGEAGVLGASDNRAANMIYTFDGDSYTWSSPTSIYWRDQQTAVDIYGYYPAVNFISNPTAYNFEVRKDQSTEAGNGDLSGYEQSDLLWGKAANVGFTTECIIVSYHHIMAGVRVQLEKGTGISDTEWEKLTKQLSIDNTVRSGTVNLSDGSIAPGTGVSPINMAPQSSDNFRAVVIPQTVAAGKQLLSITIDGLTYGYTRETAMEYQTGKLHNFTMTVNKREPSGDYEIEVTDNGITPWVNDESSHQFSALAYVTVHCPQYGTLKQCITNAGYDYKTVQNLKVTGELTTEDLTFLGQEMLELHHLNLKEVKMKHVCVYDGWNEHGSHDYDLYADDNFPGIPNHNVMSIRSLVLPHGIKRIWGMNGLRLMYSTLEVPEGVTYIGNGCFNYQEYNGVELILPSTIDSIESRAFYDCNYKCELKLNDNITYIGEAALSRCPNFYGVFHVPSKLKEFKDGMFSELGSNGSFTGEIVIPQGITEIPNGYWGGVFGVALKNRISIVLPAGLKRLMSGFGNLNSIRFNDDLEVIGGGAFYNSQLHFPIQLPSSLREIGANAFYEAALEGEVVIPENCLTVFDGAFGRNEMTKIVLPSKLEAIPNEFCAQNVYLREVNIPRFVDYIGDYAFADCPSMQTIVCLNPEPPVLGKNVFTDLEGWNRMDFDKVVLQVPEASVETYRHTEGWRDFKNITPYRELAFNIPEIVALDKGSTLEGILRTEGGWEVSECPDWVTVTPSSGTADERKVELTVTVKPLGGITDDREGQIVFRLKDKGYTTYTTVKQRYVSELKEDQKVVLQTASAGASRAIPLFIIGEGYDANDIASGQYMDDMRAQMDYFFSCEPYKSYRNYFTVSTAIAVSPEHGLDGRTRFNSGIDFYNGVFYTDENRVWEYAKSHAQGISDDNRNYVLVLLLMNTNQTLNTVKLDEGGYALAMLGKSMDSYPFEQRELVLRDLGGRAFGHLATEAVNHFTFLKACTCPGCRGWEEYQRGRALGWYENVALTGKMNEVPWSHLIFHPTYSAQVDMFEGGYNHARGTYRSENMSVMGNVPIPYFNTISRQSIVKRILEYSGEGYTFEKFIAKDKMEIPEE